MKSLRIYLIIAGVLLVVYVVAQLNRPKETDWTETLGNKDKIPFGTYVLYNRMKDIFPNSQLKTYRQPVYNVIAEDSIKGASYIIVASDVDLSKADYEQLIKYIKQGNNVLIAADGFGSLLRKNLHLSTLYNFSFKKESVPVRFLSPFINPEKYFAVDKGIGSNYFGTFDTLRAVVVGENKSHDANFLKFNFGKGSLFLTANPKMFSNYSLLTHDGAEYAATALSFLKSTPTLVVDEYYTLGDAGADSPMRVFLTNDNLQWAYYITIFSLLVFVIFEMKRRQRIIPVIEPLTNSTMEFVTVVGQVYYEKRNNANIAQKKILYLLTWLRDEYQIKTNKLDDEFKEKLTAKLGVQRSLVNDLVSYIEYINVQPIVTDRELIQLNKIIDQFYSKSR
jgi:hypothetical protein